MNNSVLDYTKRINNLTLVLSIGSFFKYSPKVVEKRIITSKYFTLFNKNLLNAQSYISSSILVKEMFPEIEINDFNNTFVEFEWIAMMYLYIIDKTGFNFETLFTYIDIETALQMFKIYHEMDLSASYDRFAELYRAKSIVKSKMSQLGLTNQEVALQTSISLPMIDALKNRHRDVRKLEVQKALMLANTLNIQIETLLNN